MSNPIFNQMQPKQENIFQKFSQFKQMMSGKDPNQVINQMLANGQITQQQLEQAKQMANQFSQFLK